MHKIITSIFVFCTLLGNLFAQQDKSFKSPYILSGGFSFSEQDRRLFFFPGQAGILEGEKSTLDYEFNLLIEKKVFEKGRLSLMSGLGYSESNTTFSRPFAQSEFGVKTLELRYVKRYTINKLAIPLDARFCISKRGKIFANARILPAFAFRKSVIDENIGKRESKWGLNFATLELLPGISKKISDRMSIGLNYRLIFLNHLDPVLFNNTLFLDKIYYEGNPLLNKKVETFNPLKVGLVLEYRLGQ